MEYISRTHLTGEQVADYSLLGGEHLRRGRKLYTTGLTLLTGALVYLAYSANTDNSVHVFQGLLIFVFSILPSLLWARTGGSRFPVFEVIMLLCANAYALPLLNANEQLAGYSQDVITHSGWAVLLYVGCANLAYRLTSGLPGRSRFWTESLLTTKVEGLVIYGMVASSLYVTISVFTDWIPYEIASVLRAVFYGLGTLSTFICAQRWGRGELDQANRMIFLCALVPQLVFSGTSLVLINSLGQIGIAMLGYLSGGKRIPWLVLGLTFALIAVLHNGKSAMREKYWEGNLPSPSISEVPAFYAEWIEYGLDRQTDSKTASRKLLERTSLMHILCLVDAYTPERQDYLYGATYRHVLPQLIPRFFWPEKPRSHVATYELSIYYGLQREEDTQTTTIAFGLLTEAYANFGYFGAIMLGVFWGFLLKKLQIWSSFSPMFSFAGLLMVLLTAWSFSAELTMAAWVSSFQQAVVVVLGVPLLIRSLLGD